MQSWLDFKLKPCVQHVVQVHICEHWRNQSALRRSSVTFQVCSVLHDPRSKKPFHVSEKSSVSNVKFEKSHQPFVVYIVEKAFDIRFQHIVDLLCHDGLIDVPHNIMTALSLLKSVGAV